MSSKKSRFDSAHSPGEKKKCSESPSKSKWESPPEDRRRKDKRRDSSHEKESTSRHSQEDYRTRNRDDRRKYNESPDRSRQNRRDSRDREDRRRYHGSPESRRRRPESPGRKRHDNTADDSRRREDSRERSNRRRDSPANKKRRDSPDHRDLRRDRRLDDDRRVNRKPQKKYDEKEYDWGKSNVKSDPEEAPIEKEKPNFGLSGALAKQTNAVEGIEVKYAEPPEARKPKRRWRLYQFKGEQSLPVLHIHRQSAYLIGRDRKVCDMPIDHPSASKQHAVLQYRLVKYETEDGKSAKRIRPYIIDLNSSNGTFLNNNKIEPSKYYELMEKDVLKFAFSSREYVLLHESSKDESDDDADDNVVEEEPAQQTENTENA